MEGATEVNRECLPLFFFVYQQQREKKNMAMQTK